jgi:hypothetical protein
MREAALREIVGKADEFQETYTSDLFNRLQKKAERDKEAS